jgi:ribosomal protein S18 acetylase RimI-like enzyme
VRVRPRDQHAPQGKAPASTVPLVIDTLPPERSAEAVALWHATGLTRSWNDPDADLRRALDGPSSTVLAVTAGERLVGTVMVGHDGHRGWLYYLAVADDHRRRGLGRALVAAAEEWLAEHVPKVQLMVRDDNAAAAAFYERLGYVHQETVVLGRRLDA